MRIIQQILQGNHGELTSFFSLSFLFIFLPFAIISFAITPKKFRRYTLLIVSYLFFLAISGILILYLLFTTISIYFCGLFIDRIYKKRKLELENCEKDKKKDIKKSYKKKARLCLLIGSLLNIGILLTLKYSNFFVENINALVNLSGDSAIEAPNFLVPIGISFFTMQAVSYIFDVYREIIPADRNLFRLSLFMAFFPQIVEGPICRYSQTAEKIWQADTIERSNLNFGLQRILYGMMKKIVIADRLNMFVKEVFENYPNYPGWIGLLAAIFYTIQLYMDFSGSMDAVMGMGQIFGITMPENFKRPFFSKTISEFWQRWHISLGAWFKDYVFYPVTLSRPMKKLTSKARKGLGNYYGPVLVGAIALFLVWLFNGLWHGAGWNYIFFGMYHFVMILLGSLTAPLTKKISEKVGIDQNSRPYKFIQVLKTTVIVIFGELFFRQETVTKGFEMVSRIFTSFSFKGFSQLAVSKLSMDGFDYGIVLVTLIIVLFVSLKNEGDKQVRDMISQKNVFIRWTLIYGLIFFIVIFGAYGRGYVPVDPIYANF